MTYELNALLGRLVGHRLYSVQFVMDHVQLHFQAAPCDDLPVLTCDVLPTVTLSGREFPPGQPGWADALWRLIPQEVTATHEESGVGIKLDFALGSIRLNPTEDELVGPEIAMLRGFEDQSWTVWRPGEDVFEALR